MPTGSQKEGGIFSIEIPLSTLARIELTKETSRTPLLENNVND